MFKLVVNIDKLNIRNTPYADPTFQNWVGDCKRDEVIFAESKEDDLKDTTTKWFKDSHNRFYWEGGIRIESQDPLVHEPVPTVTTPNSWWQDSFKIKELWKDSKGEDVVVAILDTGIDMGNDFLNKKVDLINSKNYWNDNLNIGDNDFHGTHCAGLIAASAVEDLYGIAPSAKLLIAKISNSGAIKINYIIAALNDLMKLPEVDIISMSLQVEVENQELNDLFVKAATEYNKIIVCPVGNNSNGSPVYQKVYPAELSKQYPIISICSFEKDGEYSNFNYLFPATTACPGNSIYSFTLNNNKEAVSGSSQANAVATGIIALLVSHMKKKNLKITPQAIKDILVSSSTQTNSGLYNIVYNKLSTANIFNLSNLYT